MTKNIIVSSFAGERAPDATATLAPSSSPASRGRSDKASSRMSVRVWLWLVLIALLCGGLLQWVGPHTVRQYREELIFDLMAHLRLVAWAMLGALCTGIPAGVALSRPHMLRYAERLMHIFNIGNTVPSLAVLVLALAVLGIGSGPAILALWLAAVLPVTRNTYEGLRQVQPALKEAARGVGMTSRQSLSRVELPNALPMIVGGVRTALAVVVGTAPLAFLIGADSLGTLIFPGIYLNNQPQLLLGAVSTALLALVLDAVVVLIGRMLPGQRALAMRSAV